MKFIDICAGIGGFSLGLERAGMQCVGQIEINSFCIKILNKHWPNVPKWGDIKDVKAAQLPTADLFCGGYPCQPFSLTGQRRGKKDDRHIWPEIYTLIQTKHPTWCLFENVIGHITLGLDKVITDLENEGYAVQTLNIPACAVQAPHVRKRIWILAHASSEGLERGNSNNRDFGEANGQPKITSFNLQVMEKRFYRQGNNRVLRRGDAVSHRVDRIRALGNAVVPAVVQIIGEAIIYAHYYQERGNDVSC